jgi:flagellar FliJ protein
MRPFPLEAVHVHAVREADSAAGALRAQAARLRTGEAKLAELERYLAEYIAGRSQALARGVTAGLLHDYQAFVTRLEEAIAVQRREVERLRALWAAAQARWLELHRRERALAALAARHRADELLRAARLEQRRQDEFAGRQRAGPLKIRMK